MVMTYNSLLSQIISYLNREDASTIEQIPNFIYQAEQRICRECKSLGLEVYVSGNLETGINVLPKPSRWRRSLTFNFGTGPTDTTMNTRNQLYLRSYEYLRNYWPDPTLLGKPEYYSDYGYDHLLIAPTPMDKYPFEYCYLQLPEPLSRNVSTNWLTNYAPDTLLYACLLEAIPFLKNDERIPVWEGLYNRGLASLNEQDKERLSDRANKRDSD